MSTYKHSQQCYQNCIRRKKENSKSKTKRKLVLLLKCIENVADTKTTSSTRKSGSNLSLKKTSNNDKNLQCKTKILSIIPGKDYIKTYKFDNQSLK